MSDDENTNIASMINVNTTCCGIGGRLKG